MDNELVISNAHQEQVAKHRDNERERHRLMTAALESLQNYVPGTGKRESQVQSLNRISRYGHYLRSLAQRDHMDQFEEGEIQDIYMVAKNYVENSRPFMQYCTPARFRKISSQDPIFSPGSISDANHVVVWVGPSCARNSGFSVVESRDASEHLELIMREQEVKTEETENVDTNNCGYKESPRTKKQRVMVKTQPDLMAAMRPL